MEGVIQTTLLTSTLFISSLLPQASTSATFSPLPVIGQESFYVVKENETLTDIAKSEYEDTKFVELILQDNAWIDDPDHIEAGWQIKIRKNPYLRTDDQTVISTQSASELPVVPTPSLVKSNPQLVQSAVVTIEPIPSSVTPTTGPVHVNGAATPSSLTDEQMNFLGMCESGMTATRNSGNGYYGAFQFSIGTWNSMNTGYARADLAPLDVQKDAVQRLLQRSSIWTQFPGCAAKMRSSGLL